MKTSLIVWMFLGKKMFGKNNLLRKNNCVVKVQNLNQKKT